MFVMDQSKALFCHSPHTQSALHGWTCCRVLCVLR